MMPVIEVVEVLQAPGAQRNERKQRDDGGHTTHRMTVLPRTPRLSNGSLTNALAVAASRELCWAGQVRVARHPQSVKVDEPRSAAAAPARSWWPREDHGFL